MGSNISLQRFLGYLLIFTIVTTFIIVGSLILIYRLPAIEQKIKNSVLKTPHQVGGLLTETIQTTNDHFYLLSQALERLPAEHHNTLIQEYMTDLSPFSAIYQASEQGYIKQAGVRSIGVSDYFLGVDISRNPLFLRAQNSETVVWSDQFLSPVTGLVTLGVAVKNNDKVLRGKIPIERLRALTKRWLEYIDETIIVVDSHDDWLMDNLPVNDERHGYFGRHAFVNETMGRQSEIIQIEFMGQEFYVTAKQASKIGRYIVAADPSWVF